MYTAVGHFNRVATAGLTGGQFAVTMMVMIALSLRVMVIVRQVFHRQGLCRSRDEGQHYNQLE